METILVKIIGLCKYSYFVSPGLPAITSVTSSPHVAVEDSSDILHVDVKDDMDLTSIDWYYDGKLIDIEDKHYSFPGKFVLGGWLQNVSFDEEEWSVL